MNANTDVELALCFFVSVVSPELGLNLLGTLDSMHHRRKVHQKGIPDCLDYVAMTLSHGLLDELIMHLQQPQHTGFISTHLAAEAHHVGEHDRGQLTRLGLSHRAVLPRVGKYSEVCSRLSNSARGAALGTGHTDLQFIW